MEPTAPLKTRAHAWLSARVWHLAALVLLLAVLFLAAAAIAVRNSWAAADLREQLQTERFSAADSAPDEPAPPQPSPEPSPVPPRPAAPRAAVRPQPQPAPPPAGPAQTTGWGTTDLDRAIAAFPSTFNLRQETAK